MDMNDERPPSNDRPPSCNQWRRSSLGMTMLLVAQPSCSIRPEAVSEPAAPLAGVEPRTEIVLAADVVWEPLNPARGDAGPQAADLWGNRKSEGPTGFLVRFVDGFESPPHLHNVSYRGVVVRGLVHNDDPDADALWMPTGSFWTQPKGQVHITAARGSDNVAYIEIDDGPYLVRPVGQAFASGEKPVNVDASNLVWTEWWRLDGSTAPPRSTKGIHIALLWGDPLGDAPGGLLVRVPKGGSATLLGRDAPFRAVVIDGTPTHLAVSDTVATVMDPGSILNSNGGPAPVTCDTDGGCTLYVRTEGAFDFATEPSVTHTPRSKRIVP